jgi:hypothetical protein
MRILLIEDEQDMARYLIKALNDECGDLLLVLPNYESFFFRTNVFPKAT